MFKKESFTMVILVLMILFASINVYGESGVILDINVAQKYSSDDYNTIAMTLAATYSDILKYEQIGESYDGNPIYALVMTGEIEQLYDTREFNVIKKHYLLEGGVHARETVNPAVLLKMVESYAVDYYNDDHIIGFNVKELLSTNVIHFIPLVNPDGHDLAKFGISTVASQELINLLGTIEDQNYSNWKANLRGVDINRNFPDWYVDESTGQWVNKWKKFPGDFETNVAGGTHYYGQPGSELETKSVMKYIDRYDFRTYISYHSNGQVVYHGYKWHPSEFNEKTFELASMIERINGYDLIKGTGKGGGFAPEYFASQTVQPALTVETTPVGSKFPSDQHYYATAYDETYTIPLETIRLFEDDEYGKYKLYGKDGTYVRAFSNKAYADAHSTLINGKVVVYEGKPEAKLLIVASREEALIEILSNRINLTKLTIDATDRFRDTNSLFTTLAKNLKIVKGDSFGNFYPDRRISASEYAVMYYNTDLHYGLIANDEYTKLDLKFSHPTWATDAIKYSLYTKALSEKDFLN